MTLKELKSWQHGLMRHSFIKIPLAIRDTGGLYRFAAKLKFFHVHQGGSLVALVMIFSSLPPNRPQLFPLPLRVPATNCYPMGLRTTIHHAISRLASWKRSYYGFATSRPANGRPGKSQPFHSISRQRSSTQAKR
jgi:hypothetical protein